MCGRYNLTLSPAELQEFFDLCRDLEFEREWKPRFNIAPTQSIVAIRFDEESGPGTPGLMRWGLVPRWARDIKARPQPFNARAEGVATSRMFAPLLTSKRCLIPATGFYEWRKLDSQTKQPYHIHQANDEPFAFAGLWDEWKHDGQILESCTVLTTAANDVMRPIHDRMPVIVEREWYDRWLDPHGQSDKLLKELIGEANQHAWELTEVSTFVNNARNESPQCVVAVDT